MNGNIYNILYYKFHIANGVSAIHLIFASCINFICQKPMAAINGGIV
jgi:hypothetical protein